MAKAKKKNETEPLIEAVAERLRVAETQMRLIADYKAIQAAMNRHLLEACKSAYRKAMASGSEELIKAVAELSNEATGYADNCTAFIARLEA